MTDTQAPPPVLFNSLNRLPLIPLRDVVVYPGMVVPLFVGREKSTVSIEIAYEHADKEIVLVAQKDSSQDSPAIDELYQVATTAKILQILKLSDGTIKVLVEGGERVRLDHVDLVDDSYLVADFQQVLKPAKGDYEENLLKAVKDELELFSETSRKLAKEVLTALKDISELTLLLDTVATHLAVDMAAKQEVLEAFDLELRTDKILAILDLETDARQMDKKIRARVKTQMEKSQREYYLNEQIKAIQKELGDIDSSNSELDELEEKIHTVKMSEAAEKKTLSELSKLKIMSPMSAEASVIRNYIDWMVSVPWHKTSKLKSDIPKAQRTLDKDHYGLEEVKTRILEFLAVQKRVSKLRGPILCLVGPPGVGKTSLGKSIAKATNREFVRMSLGGVRDEAEIRGHRRTYIGSMPGKIIQKLSKIDVKNPLILLDEIDKMGADLRGDPASALLEVLDPEQNSTFNDHYLEVDYDLSDVMFVCTSNSMDIPHALMDRLEIIRIPGYTEDEKVAIGQHYLLPAEIKSNGLKDQELQLEESELRNIIRNYTKEAGVRNLSRELAKICRKVVMQNSLQKKDNQIKVDDELLSGYLGPQKFSYGTAEIDNRVGQVTGLAWTQVGGDILTIESCSVEGSGKIIKTGSLGDVMQESIQAALTVVRSRSGFLGIDSDYHSKKDIHIHVPEGATPKDGPSAGVGMVIAIVSELANVAVRSDVAMTGEITLRGEVLAIGGLKEKLLAAHRAGIKTVIIPAGNEKNLVEIPDNIKKDLEIFPVKWIDKVLEIALVEMPTPKKLKVKTNQTQDTRLSERPNTH